MRRLNECIYNIVKGDAKQLDDFNRRKARDRALLTLRREARAVLFSILHRNTRPLTLKEIEDEWM
ncbi:hypothetical protein TELCIR_05626, partial [Teladorsagia circumcincta]